MKPYLERITEERPILFDGGFGTELFARGIELTNSALANELCPDIVRDIHYDYIEAGSEAIATNTFVASFPHLEMAGKTASESDGLIKLLNEAGERCTLLVLLARCRELSKLIVATRSSESPIASPGMPMTVWERLWPKLEWTFSALRQCFLLTKLLLQ